MVTWLAVLSVLKQTCGIYSLSCGGISITERLKARLWMFEFRSNEIRVLGCLYDIDPIPGTERSKA